MSDDRISQHIKD